MPPSLFLDPAGIDLERTVFDGEAIRQVNPQRHEMEMLDRIVYYDPAAGLIVGVKEVRPDGFWVRGHFPGRPVFPGVLMIEAAAQLAAFYINKVQDKPRVIGFAAVDDVRFRRQLVPGDKFVVVGRQRVLREKLGCLETQGLVNGNLAFSATITGMAI